LATVPTRTPLFKDDDVPVLVARSLQLESSQRESSTSSEEMRALAARCGAAEAERARLSEVGWTGRNGFKDDVQL
jgi:hypothetical protein